MARFTAAAIQMRSGTEPGRNAADFEQLVREASRAGATYVQTPEMTGAVVRDREARSLAFKPEEHDGIAIAARRLAAELGIYLHVGSTAIVRPDGKLANRAMLFAPDGALAARYDKIHMFDVDLASGESWRESSAYAPGEEVVTAETPLGRLGLTVCYDVRFPALYEELGRRRCDAIAIPAAFTVPTGRAHWHLLVRARAVEASAFVIAAAQAGQHADGRRTYGHSLVVDPWGEVLLDLGEEPGLGFATIEPGRLAEVRAQLPSLANKREIPRSREP